MMTTLRCVATLAIVMSIGTHGSTLAQQRVTIDSLRSVGVVRVKLDGRRVPSPVDGKEVVYLELVTGVRSRASWESYTIDSRTSDDLLITTPLGTVSLPPIRLRLYLRPSSMRRVRGTTDYRAEYRLIPRRTYYARVVGEQFYLPPRGQGLPPSTGTNYVLQVSDRPFVNGKPQGDLTPATRDISY